MPSPVVGEERSLAVTGSHVRRDRDMDTDTHTDRQIQALPGYGTCIHNLSAEAGLGVKVESGRCCRCSMSLYHISPGEGGKNWLCPQAGGSTSEAEVGFLPCTDAVSGEQHAPSPSPGSANANILQMLLSCPSRISDTVLDVLPGAATAPLLQDR